jgi:hypothetical protein
MLDDQDGNPLRPTQAVLFVEMESCKAVKSVMMVETMAINDIVMQHVMDRHQHFLVAASLMFLS